MTKSRNRKPCATELCENTTTRTWCMACGRLERGKLTRGEQHWNYKGGSYINSKGYVVISGKQGHPNASERGQMKEHIFVKTEEMGRPLIEGESVHHKNGIKHDNRLENLELWWHQPSGQRVSDLIAYLESTGYEVNKK